MDVLFVFLLLFQIVRVLLSALGLNNERVSFVIYTERENSLREQMDFRLNINPLNVIISIDLYLTCDSMWFIFQSLVCLHSVVLAKQIQTKSFHMAYDHFNAMES